MTGAHDGPGLRTLALAIGVDPGTFSQATQAMQAIPPYEPGMENGAPAAGAPAGAGGGVASAPGLGWAPSGGGAPEGAPVMNAGALADTALAGPQSYGFLPQGSQ